MKVTTDACLFGAWVAEKVSSPELGVGSQPLKIKTILDIGAGTCLLSLMLAQKCDAKIDDIKIADKAAAPASEK